MRFCHHQFVLMKTEYNEISKRMGCGYLWYRCPKCGKMVRDLYVSTKHSIYDSGWHEMLKNKM